MITALGRIDVEQDFQLVVERWEGQNCQDYLTNMKKSCAGTKLGSAPRTKWNMWSFNVGRVDQNLGCRLIGAEQCKTLVRVF